MGLAGQRGERANRGWLWACWLGLLCLLVPLTAQELGEPEPPAPVTLLDLSVAPARHFTVADAIVLGLVEGLTEYLPVSSTGHLILANHWLGLSEELPQYDRQGQPLYEVAPGPAEPLGRPFTLRAAADTYTIVIQGGAILAVLFLYWGRILQLLAGVIGRDPVGRRLAGLLILAFLPAAVIGLLLDDWLEAHLFNPPAVAVALLAGSGLMWGAEAWRKRRQARLGPAAPEPAISDLSPRQAVLIGFWQCLAMWPGTSRSMATIVGGYFAGLGPRAAAEFSFLLGLLTLSAASGYKLLKNGQLMMQVLDPGPALLGIAVATVAAALAVKWLVGWLGQHGLEAFAWYRVGLAVLVLIFWQS